MTRTVHANYKQYLPLQPGFETCSQYNNHVVKPDNILYGCVSEFYQFYIKSNKEKTYTIPDGCGDIVLQIHENGIQPIVCGGKTHLADISFLSCASVFGIRFNPGKIAAFLNCDASELVENRIPLDLVFSHDIDFADNIISAKNFGQRVKLVSNILKSAMAHKRPLPEVVKHCINIIISTSGDISVKALAEMVEFSPRYIEKLFAAHVGFTPKQLIIFIRFQRSVHMSTLTESGSLTEIAYECGYYDQSHMNRTYKNLSKMQPSIFRNSYDRQMDD